MQKEIVLQPEIPPTQRAAAAARLPAMRPVAQGEWLRADAAYSGQLAEKARLIRADRDAVIAVLPGAEDASAELLTTVLAELAVAPGYAFVGEGILRPDGAVVEVDARDPMLTLSRLVQEDFCVLQKQGDEHVLTAALLCFPASWTLREKIGRPLMRIHKTVDSYDIGIGQRVQRLFDGVQPGRPVWRANLLRYADPSLYHPRTEGQPPDPARKAGQYERSERQTVLRLPGTGAVVFSIHTTLAPYRGEEV